MKIYTRTGDGGETGLFGGGRVPKSHKRVEAYGSVDELSAFLGNALTEIGDEQSAVLLRQVQADLFAIGSVLATAPAESGRPRPKVPELPEDRVGEMEDWIDTVTERLPALRNFVLPGGTSAAAALHLARTVCRRAERAVVELGENAPEREGILRYLNRLSDVLFVMARLENDQAGVGDTLWKAD